MRWQGEYVLPFPMGINHGARRAQRTCWLEFESLLYCAAMRFDVLKEPESRQGSSGRRGAACSVLTYRYHLRRAINDDNDTIVEL